jgi:hypothetical protein
VKESNHPDFAQTCDLYLRGVTDTSGARPISKGERKNDDRGLHYQ